ncbi:hypothetical protein Syun_009973 [Stephania yunnanensis]|uniref:Cytochrome P450 n=1 Tax=Stephania yunnanensis TaxID=152371 RepID=A0AAP0KHR3_9MAGN
MDFLFILFFITTLVLTVYKLQLIKTTKKNLPPSPPGALPIIGHLRLVLSATKPFHRTLQALSSSSTQYADYMLLKLGVRNVVVLSSPHAVEECIHKNDVAFANRPHSIAFDYYSYNYTQISMTDYGPHWRNLRRFTTANIFSSTSLHASSDVRHDAVRCLLRDLYKSTNNIGAPQKIDLKSKFFELTFNSTMSMLTGDPIGDGLCHTKENNWFFDVLRGAKAPVLFLAPGDYLPIFNYFDVFKVKQSLAASSKNRDAYFEEIIERYRSNCLAKKKPKSILDVLFSLQQEHPEQYNHVIVKGIILKLKKALDELDHNIEPHRLLEDSNLSNLPYIQSIIQETLRLFPPAPFLVPHVSASDCKVDQYDVPSGTIIVANLWAIHRDPKVWPEPHKFMPERFMQLQGLGQGDSNNKFKFIPFGIGRRGCPGDGLAMHTITLALGSVLRCFEWEKIGDEPIDMSEGVQFLLPKAKALEALCKPRSEMLSRMLVESHIPNRA